MRTLFREFVVAKRRSEDKHDQRMVLAWTIEGLHRQKTLPNVKTLLANRQVRQNAKQMLAVVELISEAYGLPLRKGKKKKR